jgi:hypothetical protein
MQINPPEPEYFFAIFGAFVMLFLCTLVSLCIFYFGRKRNSKALKVAAAPPFAFFCKDMRSELLPRPCSGRVRAVRATDSERELKSLKVSLKIRPWPHQNPFI